MWKYEKDFVKHVQQTLLADVTCYRIETHRTANGVPDMYVTAAGDDWFLEFKNMPEASVNNKQFKIDWRPGQQRFMMDYKNGHARYFNGHVFRKCGWTLVGLSDGIIAIKHDRFYKGDIVLADEVYQIKNKVNLVRFLFDNSYECSQYTNGLAQMEFAASRLGHTDIDYGHVPEFKKLADAFEYVRSLIMNVKEDK